MKHILFAILSLITQTLVLHAEAQSAQIDTINIEKSDLITFNLKPGLNQYLVYFENPSKKRIGNSSIWNRQVNFKSIGGRDIIEIEQYWYMSDTTFNRYVYSISDKKTFAPIFHKTKMRGAVEAFDFDGKKVVGSDSVANNTKKDLNVPLTVTTLNWELDLEIFSTFPIKKEGQRFIINFYHPGGKSEPRYYEYAIVGSEKIQIVNDLSIDCWKMKINYSPDTWAIFWISKKSKEVLKMQEYFRGGYRYKIKFLTPIEMSN
jgi:hypothetical protein